MKITALEHLHADAGQRNFDFLKITADSGLVGWSEYNESFGGAGVSAVIAGLAPQIIGRDPRAYESLITLLYAVRRQAAGGIAPDLPGRLRPGFGRHALNRRIGHGQAGSTRPEPPPITLWLWIRYGAMTPP